MRHSALADFLAESRPRRIEDNQIERQLGSAFREERFGRGAQALHVRRSIVLQVGERVRRGLYGKHLIEVTRQMGGKQSRTGIKIKRCAPCMLADDDLDQLVDKKSIGLKERAAADAIVLSGGAIDQRLFADEL